MIKMIAAICRRPGMTHLEYLAYVHRIHAAISRENPVTLRRYVQNHTFDAAFGTSAEAEHCMQVSRDSVTELYWDSLESMGQTFAHEYVRTKVGPDARNFADQSVSLSLVAVEAEQPVLNPGGGAGAKLMHFLRAAPGLSLEDFFSRWSKAHELALRAEPIAAATVRRCVHSRQRPQANAMLAYFNAKDAPIYEGVASLWYDDPSSIGAFRAYERALLEINGRPETVFYQPAQSFFLYTTEVEIFSRESGGVAGNGI